MPVNCGVRREDQLAAVDEALAARQPLEMPRNALPANRLVEYLITGQGLSRLLWARSTGQPEVWPLQVRNQGAVTNFPPDVRVEVPCLIAGDRIQPLPVGALPEWLGGYTRLLALQRQRAADYLCDGRLETLQQALFTLPTVADVQTLHRYAEEIHHLRP
jgi:alpha-galactosidase/6-phospho-beta-glucosidase family protein